jgi:hypothetical protein
MIGITNLDLDGFTAQDVLNELKDIVREARTTPAAKGRRQQVNDRVNKILDILSTAGIAPDGITLLALAKIGETAREGIAATVEMQTAIQGILETIREGK